jgi:N-acetyl-gamma-glutamyl-phosphate reductase
MYKVFIDGKEGTTGLRIYDRLALREDITILTLSDELRKDAGQRRAALNSCDIAFLCLPDEAAIEAVSLVTNPSVKIIDASTAHRTNPQWCYGFPELSKEHYEAVKSSKRVAVPGCHASGFIALTAPLVKEGLLSEEALLSCCSLTGYSGGGKKMIAQYEDTNRSRLYEAPRLYALTQSHKHLPEMAHVCGLKSKPIFMPIVSDFYSGMLVTLPLFPQMLKKGCGIDDIKRVYTNLYTGPVMNYVDAMDEEGFVSACSMSGSDRMEVTVTGNSDRIVLAARFDNLGKGASGAAIECMNIMLGLAPEKGLVL